VYLESFIITITFKPFTYLLFSSYIPLTGVWVYFNEKVREDCGIALRYFCEHSSKQAYHPGQYILSNQKKLDFGRVSGLFFSMELCIKMAHSTMPTA
jgi:hypothetical protein